MKRVLITGVDSYIGDKVRTYLENYSYEYQVDDLDMRDDSWQTFDYSSYDVIYHVAAIVHRNENDTDPDLYFKVNRDLAYNVAKTAKKSGVGQFIFMSSMSVYGMIYSNEAIGLNTKCNPDTNYGKSKLEAEKLLLSLDDNKFRVCVLRPPMVLGDGAPGNMEKLIKAVNIVKIFPNYCNERSYITVDTLSAFIERLIDEESSGVFLPQEHEYLCTYNFIKDYMKKLGVNVHYTKLFNPIIKFLVGRINTVSKCFGDLKYEK